MLRRTALLLVRAASVLCLILGLALWLLPVSLLDKLPGAKNMTLLAGSRLYRGQALSLETDLVRWRWCPSEGLLKVCVSLSGNRRYLEAVVSPGMQGPKLEALEFSGYRLADLGITALGDQAAVSGSVREGQLIWRGQCLLPDGPLTADIRLSRLANPAISDGLDFRLKTTGDQVLDIAGDGIEGQFQWRNTGVKGELTLSPDLVPESVSQTLSNSGGAGYRLPVAWRVSCGQ